MTQDFREILILISHKTQVTFMSSYIETELFLVWLFCVKG